MIPLLLYHTGNRALLITVSSLLYYNNPTTHMVIGLLYFRLSIPLWEWVVFGLIWAGLIVYFATRRQAGPAVRFQQ